MIKFVLGWLAGAVVLALGAAIVEAQLSLAMLPEAAGPISLADRARHTLATLQGFALTFGAICAAALLLLFLLAAGLARMAKSARAALYGLAGAAAPVAVIATFQAIFGQPIIAGSSSLTGMAAQAVVGAIAGLAAARVARPA